MHRLDLFRGAVPATVARGATTVAYRQVSFRLIFAWYVGVVVCAGAATVMVSYPQQVTARGLLLPSGGIIQVSCPSTCTVKRVYVTPGSNVEAGAYLARVSTDASLSSGSFTKEKLDAIDDQIATERLLISSEKSKTQIDLDDVAQSRFKLVSFRGVDAKETVLQAAQNEILLTALNRALDVSKTGFVSLAELDTDRQRLLAGQQALAELQKVQAGIVSDLSALEIQSRRDGEALKEEQSAHFETIQKLLSERLDVEKGGDTILTSPSRATVSDIAYDIGQTLSTQDKLVTLLPIGSHLVAELYIPSRDVGFVRAGQQVLVRYDAFPFARYGSQSEKLSAITLSVVDTEGVPAPARQSGSNTYFRIDVALPSSSFQSLGLALPLKVGMTVTGVIVVRNTTVLSWIEERLSQAAGPAARD